MPTVFHWVGWLLLACAFAEVAAAVIVFFLGDRSKSRIDRVATWVACHLKDDDGVPLVEPGTEPTTLRKILSVGYVLAALAIMLWFSAKFRASR